MTDTGKASGRKAVTGVVAKADSVGTIRVERSGDATASIDGEAVTGVELG